MDEALKKKLLLGGSLSAIAIAGVLFARALLGGSNTPGPDALRNMAEGMPIDELKARRAAAHKLVADAEAKGATDAPWYLKQKKGLDEIDAILRARGVDPETVTLAADGKSNNVGGP